MTSKKKILIPVLVVAVAAAAGAGVTTVYANGHGFGEGPMFGGGEGRNHDEMMTAMESGDYDTWKSLVVAKADEFASEENFNNLKQIHDLMKEGKTEEAKQLREDLDMPSKGHRLRGAGKGEMRGIIMKAVKDNDFEAWKAAMEDNVVNKLEELEGKINKDTFNKLVEAHQAMESGDRESAREIREEIGFPLGPHGGGHGRVFK